MNKVLGFMIKLMDRSRGQRERTDGPSKGSGRLTRRVLLVVQVGPFLGEMIKWFYWT